MELIKLVQNIHAQPFFTLTSYSNDAQAYGTLGQLVLYGYNKEITINVLYNLRHG